MTAPSLVLIDPDEPRFWWLRWIVAQEHTRDRDTLVWRKHGVCAGFRTAVDLGHWTFRPLVMDEDSARLWLKVRVVSEARTVERERQRAAVAPGEAPPAAE
jgi:hypothetical protein